MAKCLTNYPDTWHAKNINTPVIFKTSLGQIFPAEEALLAISLKHKSTVWQSYLESVECLLSVLDLLGSFLSAGFFPAGSFLACNV